MNVVPPSTNTPDDAALQAMYQAGYNHAYNELARARARLGEERAALDRQREDLHHLYTATGNRLAELNAARHAELGATWLRIRHPTWEEQVAGRMTVMEECARRHHAARGTTEWTGLADPIELAA